MKKQELLAAISDIEKQLAVLKELVLAESEVNEPQEEAPVVNEPVEEKREELPAPPKVIYVDLPKDKEESKEEVDEDVVLGCQIITALPDFYSGECRLLKLHKRYFDNGQPKLFIDKYHVVVEAYDVNMRQIGSYTTHWNNLSQFHVELIKRGINGHKKDNWKPNTVCLDLD